MQEKRSIRQIIAEMPDKILDTEVVGAGIILVTEPDESLFDVTCDTIGVLSDPELYRDVMAKLKKEPATEMLPIKGVLNAHH